MYKKFVLLFLFILADIASKSRIFTIFVLFILLLLYIILRERINREVLLDSIDLLVSLFSIPIYTYSFYILTGKYLYTEIVIGLNKVLITVFLGSLIASTIILTSIIRFYWDLEVNSIEFSISLIALSNIFLFVILNLSGLSSYLETGSFSLVEPVSINLAALSVSALTLLILSEMIYSIIFKYRIVRQD